MGCDVIDFSYGKIKGATVISIKVLLCLNYRKDLVI